MPEPCCWGRAIGRSGWSSGLPNVSAMAARWRWSSMRSAPWWGSASSGLRWPEPDGVDGHLTASMCQSWVVDKANRQAPSMNEITTVGLDLAKSVFQVQGVDGDGRVVVLRSLRRGQVLKYFTKQPACLIGMEACATAHCWGRELARRGHDV